MFYDPAEQAFQLSGVFHVHRPPRDTTARGRTHTALSFKLSGNAIYDDGDGEINAGKGDIVYIPAGVDYRIKNTKEELIIVHLKNYGAPGHAIEVERGADELSSLFQKLYDEWEAGGVAYQNRCTAILYSIFETLEQLRQKEKNPVPDAIYPGVSFLQQNFRDPQLSIAALAKRCYMSEGYFRRLYREHFGISPLQAVLNLRFEYACSLLRSGYYQTKQIADLSGFSDVKYFRTAFRKRYRLTPAEYAAKARK